MQSKDNKDQNSTATVPAASTDARKSKAFQAFLASVAERDEVYRRLADS